MKIAVVRNRKNPGIISRLGLPSPERYGRRSVQGVMDALRAGGHTVRVFEGDMDLLGRLERFFGTERGSEYPGGMVFNMSYGIQGECRYAHTPLILEMAGVPYTGAGPHGHMLSLDKVVAKYQMERFGVPVPRFQTVSRPDEGTDGLRYPLVVKPCHESTSNGLRLVHHRDELREAVAEIVARYRQDALVEEYVDGREVTVGLLGNDPVEVLPIVELDFDGRPIHMLTRPDKFHKTPDEPEKVCPAPLDDVLAERLRRIAVAVFRACRCRDYARVDIRLDRSGNPYVLEINSMASLGRGGAYVLAASHAGYEFEDLVCRIVDVAHQRYFGIPAPHRRPRRRDVRAVAGN